ncbi:polymerase [Pseudovibrio japonicus]|uniref:Polymerase n=1 Tax=Pseudovibrio japonicus TaxID=366534 RepID=A0ABQ3DYF3_9HYPH|nr:alpha/beta fold hydrolase [Pseudovibrio japonicus]GHB20358.1 polymerase [Pseudovibrio japonicus]
MANEQANVRKSGKSSDGVHSKRAKQSKVPHGAIETNGTLEITGAHKPLPTDVQRIKHSHPLDRLIHAWLGKATFGLSPISLNMALFDWAAHLSIYPSKQTELSESALQKLALLSIYWAKVTGPSQEEIEPVAKPRPQDYRFTDAAWNEWPFNAYYQGFLLAESWVDQSTRDIQGVSRHHTEIVNFYTRQLLDVFSPSNSLWTNPEVVRKTVQDGGANLLNGVENYLEDFTRILTEAPVPGTEKFRKGIEVACTPGKVIYRNHLMELIQYSPTTEQTHPEPILIVPAWIMKYYILDLSPDNSLVKYLVDHGHTVFMISWRNPDADDWNLGLDNYLKLGVLDALKVIQSIVSGQKIHATGYCLGGTLLSIATAYLAREKSDILKTVTLFAAQTDFEEAGELMLFVDESQLAAIEDSMWQQGFLDKGQMAGAFNMLRSNDLVWSRIIHDYLIGERRPLNDLMAWNADATRLPFRMHSEYLRKLYLNNELTEGHYKVDGRSVALTDIKVPIFAVGTQRDHVAPWRSVYKLNLYMNTEVTFVLTSGGHNAGIVSEPGHKGRRYQKYCRKCQGSKSYMAPENWIETAPCYEGSWWPAWQQWLLEQSSEKTSPPPLGCPKAGYSPLCDAPGKYILQE